MGYDGQWIPERDTLSVQNEARRQAYEDELAEDREHLDLLVYYMKNARFTCLTRATEIARSVTLRAKIIEAKELLAKH